MLVISLLFACTDPDPATGMPPTPIIGDTANYSGSLGPSPDFSDAHSRFTAVHYDFEGTAVLSGAFADGPPLRFHVEAEREGNCRLMRYTPSTCDPTCTPGVEACIDGVCQAYASREAHGSVTWTHPAGEQSVEPDGTNAYYATASFSDAGPMSLGFDATTLAVPVAPPLEADGDFEAQLDARGDGDGVLRWTNPYDGARIRLMMTDCEATHGGIAAAEIECEGPDTGELVIPAAFLQALAEGDWTHGECGSHVFERYHAASPVEDDGMRFESLGPGGLFYRF